MGEEGRRFLRFVMPGLLFGVETLLFLFILLPEPTLCVLSKVISKEALGTSVAAFLASGALGYIFAAIHHFVHWLPCCLRFEKDIFNHKEVIDTLLKANLISPSGFDIDKRIEQYNKDEKTSIEKRKIAESISMALWNYFAKDEHLGKNQIDHLGNQAHGLGAARIASLFALITAILVAVFYGTLDFDWCLALRFVLTVILGCFFVCMFHKAYVRVAFLAHETYTMILQNECAKPKPLSYRKNQRRLN